MSKEKGAPFAVFCPDGFVPELTLAAVSNGDGEQKAAMYGKGSRAQLMSLLTGLIRATLECLDAEDIALCLAVATKDAEDDGIDTGIERMHSDMDKKLDAILGLSKLLGIDEDNDDDDEDDDDE